MSRVTEEEQAVQDQVQRMALEAQLLGKADARLQELAEAGHSSSEDMLAVQAEGQEMARRCFAARNEIRNLVILELSDGTLAQLLEVNDMLLAMLTQWEATASQSLKHVANSTPSARNTAAQPHVAVTADQDLNASARAQPGLLEPAASTQAHSEGIAVATGTRSGGLQAGVQTLPERGSSSMASATDAWAQLESVIPASSWAAVAPSQPATLRPVLSEAEFSDPMKAQQAPVGWQNFGGQKSELMTASMPPLVGQPYVHALPINSQSATVPIQHELRVRPVLSETDFSQTPAASFPPSSWGMPAGLQQGLAGPSLPSSLPTPSTLPPEAFTRASSGLPESIGQASLASSLAAASSTAQGHAPPQLAGQRGVDMWEGEHIGPPGQADGATSLSIRPSQSGDEEAEEPWTPVGEEVEPWTEFGSPKKDACGPVKPIVATTSSSSVSNGLHAHLEISRKDYDAAGSSRVLRGLGPAQASAQKTEGSTLSVSDVNAIGRKPLSNVLQPDSGVPVPTSAPSHPDENEDDKVELRMEIMHLQYQQQQHLAQLDEAAKRESLRAQEADSLKQQVLQLQQRSAAVEGEKRSLMLLLDEAADEQRRLASLMESTTRQLREKEQQVVLLAKQQPAPQPTSPTRMVSDCSSLSTSAWLPKQENTTPRPLSARNASPPNKALEAYYHQPALRVRFSAEQFQDLTQKLHLPKAARAQSLRLP